MSKAKFGKTSLFLPIDNSDIKESTHVILQKKIFNMQKKVFDINYKRKNVLCWWCCHTFDNEKVHLPKRKDAFNKLFVMGIFCSYNCAKSYGIESKFDTYLFKNYYEFKTKQNFLNLKRAPPRQSLYVFGGILTISEFRENFTSDTTSIEASSYPIIHEIEQIAVSKVKKFIDKSYNYKPKKIKGKETKIENNNLTQLISYV